MPATSILPLHYDAEYIIAKAGLTNHYGYEAKHDGIYLVYPVESYDLIQRLINDYDVDYLEIAVPRKLDEITAIRKQKVLDFNFQGSPVELDQVTLTNLVGGALGLMRNETVQALNWQIAPHEFATLPRDYVLEFADSAFLHVQACFNNARLLFDQVRACENLDQLRSIDVEAGWPS